MIQRDEATELKNEAKKLMDHADDRLNRIIQKQKDIVVLEQHYREDKNR